MRHVLLPVEQMIWITRCSCLNAQIRCDIRLPDHACALNRSKHSVETKPMQNELDFDKFVIVDDQPRKMDLPGLRVVDSDVEADHFPLLGLFIVHPGITRVLRCRSWVRGRSRLPALHWGAGKPNSINPNCEKTTTTCKHRVVTNQNLMKLPCRPF